MNPELLLSDEFVEFAKKIAELHQKKKTLSNELKLLVQKHQKEINDINDQVAKLNQEFQANSKK
jgi:uncharacterized protein YoxC